MHQDWLELTYYITGAISAFMGLFVTYVFITKNANFVRSRIFLKYGLFKTGFFILIGGLLVFAAANILAILDIEYFHEVGEIVHNVSMILFITMMCMILDPRRKK